MSREFLPPDPSVWVARTRTYRFVCTAHTSSDRIHFLPHGYELISEVVHEPPEFPMGPNPHSPTLGYERTMNMSCVPPGILPPGDQPQSMIYDVMEFHRCFGHPILERPAMPPADRQHGRKHMLTEEFFEGIDLLDAPVQAGPDGIKQLAEIGDWLADLIYYAIGGALEYGIPLAAIWDEVQRANMSKLWTEREVSADGTQMNLIECGWTATLARPPMPPSQPESLDYPCYTVKDDKGKVRKPPSWKDPDIIGIIARAMHPETEWSKTARGADPGTPPDIANSIDRGPDRPEDHEEDYRACASDEMGP